MFLSILRILTSIVLKTFLNITVSIRCIIIIIIYIIMIILSGLFAEEGASLQQRYL